MKSYMFPSTNEYENILNSSVKELEYSEKDEKAFNKELRDVQGGGLMGKLFKPSAEELNKRKKEIENLTSIHEYHRQYKSDCLDYINNWHDAEYDVAQNKAEYYRNISKKIYDNAENYYESLSLIFPHPDRWSAMSYLFEAAVIASELAYVIDEKGFDAPEVSEFEIIFRGILKQYRECRVLMVEDLNSDSNIFVEFDPESRREILIMEHFGVKDVYRMDSFDDFDAERAMIIWYGENVLGKDMTKYAEAVVEKTGRDPLYKTQGPRLAVARLRTKYSLKMEEYIAQDLRGEKESRGLRKLDNNLDECEQRVEELKAELADIDSRIAASGILDELAPAKIPNFFS